MCIFNTGTNREGLGGHGRLSEGGWDASGVVGVERERGESGT